MPDFNLALLEVDFNIPATFAFSLTTATPNIAVPTAALAATNWQVVSVGMTGLQYANYPHAKVTGVQYSGISAPIGVTFDIPIDEPLLDQLPLANAGTTPLREVQVWRNGHLIFWGPPVTRRCSSDEKVWHYQAWDPLWYLEHRNIGQANRHNYLTNGSFDASTGGWTPIGSISTSIDTNRYVLGGASVEVSASSSGENFLRQRFTKTSGPLGLAMFLTAWVYVDSFTVGAFGLRGPFIQREGATGIGAVGFATVDENTPLGTWQRMTAHINMPPNVTETIQVRLYAWDGTGHYDANSVTVMESVSLIDENSPGGAGWDQVRIAHQVCRYLSGSWPVGPSYSKSNLRLAVAGADSGIKKERTYQFFDHQPGYQGGTGNGALDEWPKSEEGFDYRIDYDSPQVRTFRTFYPAVGLVWGDTEVTGTAPDPHTAFALTRAVVGDEVVGSTWGIVGYEMGETIEGSATDVCELGGFGDDSGREEGAFEDAGALGDLTLELVEAAPADAPIDLLNSLAAQRGAQIAKPISTPVLIMVEPKDELTGEVLVPLIGVLRPGDLIPAVVDEFSVQLDGVFRVTKVDVREDESLAVAIAP